MPENKDPYKLTERFSVKLSSAQYMALMELARIHQTAGAGTILRMMMNKYLPVEYPEYPDLLAQFMGEPDE